MDRAGRSSVPGEIEALIAREIAGYDGTAPGAAATLAAFRAARHAPRPITVNFSGGITQTCWSVTRTDGDYQVIYLPTAGYFSLCVESVFGPLDIGVHGDAIGCYASV
ncbi:hypothetical protein [Pseudodonghicola flavimaris]|uniref:Uncharacterized protein n=1 Tax=Pseudodonghicola flavimaris TaxID=3050036 RepID=A0ABT7EVH0_9RHOB|nr:hypothetical protein [Pseudodonghicola flavimaris]MDK3016289.1 hypothetical protein [Pseudodonghicola flavimaris]